MMKDCFEGWEEKDRVQIPDIKEQGFREDIIIRKPVSPVREKKQERYAGEPSAVPPVPGAKTQAYVKRLSTGEEAPVDKDEFVIGKSADSDFVVKFNPTVSRKHVKIYTRKDGFWLEDMGSSNHVFVEGRQITVPVKLTDGMRFTLSLDEEFEFLVRMRK